MAVGTHGTRGAFNAVRQRPLCRCESATDRVRQVEAWNNPSYDDDHRRSRQDPLRRLRPVGGRTGPGGRVLGRRSRDPATTLVNRAGPGGRCTVGAGADSRRGRGDLERRVGRPRRPRATTTVRRSPSLAPHGGRFGCPDPSGDHRAVPPYGARGPRKQPPKCRVHRGAGRHGARASGPRGGLRAGCALPGRAGPYGRARWATGRRRSVANRDRNPGFSESAHLIRNQVTADEGSAQAAGAPHVIGEVCRIPLRPGKRSYAGMTCRV